MEFVQGPITTLHDFGAADPSGPAARATVVVPMVGREARTAAARRLFAGLERVDPLEVVVPLRAEPGRAAGVAAWLEGFDVPVRVLYCAGDRLEALLARHGLDGPQGKGSDVWLALGVARGDQVVLHDADARTYEPGDTRKLLAPLTGEVAGAARDVAAKGDASPPADGDAGTRRDAGPRDDTTPPADAPAADPFAFVKGYYARVEAGRLYGRLTRLFFDPLVDALAARHDDSLLEYLGAFRYGLAGECALSTPLARSLPVERRFGFEVGTLVGAHAAAGPDATAQVDLGRYEHDHRAVEGPGGLSAVSEEVAGALFTGLAARDVPVDYPALREAYRGAARKRVRADAADAAFNGLAHDAAAALAQVETYADAVAPPGPDDRLPAWDDASLDPAAVERAAAADLDVARDDPGALATDGDGPP
ncbi:MAG: glycosyl transferase family 2 [Halobacteriaceae archaeon]